MLFRSAYELRYAADTKGMSGSTACTLPKGTLELRLKALPNDAGWDETDLRFVSIGSCTPAYVTLQWNPAIISADGKKILGQGVEWVGTSSTPSSGVARTVAFGAALNVAQTVPQPKGARLGAHGLFSAKLSGTTLTWTLTFSGLAGAATAAHIHKGARGKSGGVLIALCHPCTSPAKGAATLTAAQITLLEKAGAYVDLHTAKNPKGEIRGQITQSAR